MKLLQQVKRLASRVLPNRKKKRKSAGRANTYTPGMTAVDLWRRNYRAVEPVAKRAGQKRAAARFAAAIKAQPKTSPKPPSRQVLRRYAMGRGPEFLRA